VRANRSVLRRLPGGQAPPQHVHRKVWSAGADEPTVITGIRIAGRPTESQQEAAVSRNAVANFAKAREIDKQPFLEQRRDRGVQIG
jgi:hypothetical protein